MGVGVRSPFGVGVDALINPLFQGGSAIARYEPFVLAGLRAPVAACMDDAWLGGASCEPWWDRGTRMLWAGICDALLDACGQSTLAGLGVSAHRIALVTGTSSSGIGGLSRAIQTGTAPIHDDANYYASSWNVARRLGVQGPVLVVGGVCASGALAIAEAAELIEQGVVDLALAAGFDPLEPFVGAGFDTLGALSDQPWPFRLGRRGLVLGEAAAALVLSREPGGAHRGVLAGWGSGTDAHHLTAPHPQGQGVVLAIERALACAGLQAEDVGVINAHGTGTVFNDAMESIAFQRVWGARAGNRPVHTVKGAIGHTLGAAGAIEAVVSMEALRMRQVPPTVTGTQLDPACDVDLVVGAARPSDASVAISVSAGFGGINCALLLACPTSADGRPVHSDRAVSLRSSAVWVAGHWIDRLEDLDIERSDAVETIDLGILATSRRLQRADRATRIGAMVVARALSGLEAVQRVSILTASSLASACSDEAWETRRIQRLRPDPRTFAYTATNAVAGEIAIALEARGPSIALVGEGEASLAVFDRARCWVARGLCDRAIVLAYECPPERSARTTTRAVACGVAIVLQAADAPSFPCPRVRWIAPGSRPLRSKSRTVAVEPLARLALSGGSCPVVAQPVAGGWVEVMV
jgi:3-oxoacyl-[acyl-carrier-protein] synthase II